MPQDKKTYKYEVPLDGKLITAEPPAKIGPNYQQLTNMRYTPKSIEGVGGMAKINTSVMNATYLKTRSAIHFKKNQPAESHVVAEAFNTGETTARILQNTTAIPSAGNFSATSLYSPSTSAAGPGRFSLAPDGDLAYCNGEESVIWGGAEREIAGFVNYDPDGDFSYDFTEQMRNTKTDSANIASLSVRSSGIDANVMLLLHLDNNVTDSSPTTAHTVTNHNVTFATADVGFYDSTHKAVFTTNAYLSIPDNADFNLSGGDFCIDMRVGLDDLTSDYSLYYQNTTNDDDSFNLMIDTNGAVLCRIKSGGTKQFSGEIDFTTADGVISAQSVGTHIELDHSGNDWYIFVNGSLKAYLSDAAEPDNYTEVVKIGYDGTTYLEGNIDEIRVSNTLRHSAEFETPGWEYSTETTAIGFAIAAVRPLDGFKLYSETANTAASTMTAYYWDGSAWASVSAIDDSTSASGKSLAQTGSVTFTSTDGFAKLKYFNGVLAYWYKVKVSASASSPAIYYATISSPMQTMKDIWDGKPRSIDSFQIYKGGYTDATLHVREDEYDSLNSGTFVELDGLTTGQHFICGFSEKMSGVSFYFPNGKEHSTTGTSCVVYYWTGAAWASVGEIDDDTMSGTISFGKSGSIAWQPPATEHRQVINAKRLAAGTELLPYQQNKKKNRVEYRNRFAQTINNDVRLYYYRFTFSKNLDADVILFNVTGIPAPTDIGAYKFPFLANDRLWLCSDQKGMKNTVVCSADGSSSVFNGDDSLLFRFGDDTELMGAAWLFTSVGSSIYNVMLFFKRSETWAIIGNDTEEWTSGKYRISSVVGCVAPHTIKVVDLGPTKVHGLNRSIVVWQTSDGIYMSDGRAPIKISHDIDDKFDQRATGCINSSEIGNSDAFWDGNNQCYHWLWASGSNTDLDQEWVFDFKKLGWFQIDRTSDLQYGIEAEDTYGNKYNYGFLNTGYMERLEYGTDFDGTDITQTFHTGDMALVDGSIAEETAIERVCLLNTTKSTTSNSITLTHYGDGDTGSGDSWTELPTKTGYDITMPVQHEKLGAHIFHSLKAALTTDDETVGFQPLYLYFIYSRVRDHKRDWR